MSIQPVSRERHAHLRWKGFSSFAFAASTTLAPLAAAEISQAALALPLAFIERDGHWSMAAVLGLMPGQNLYVDAGGVWLGRYIPAALRGYPFLIGARADSEPPPCIDASSGLVTPGEGEPFFDEAGSLSPTVTQVMRFLEQTAQSEATLVDACETLASFAVLEA
ncbi:hypothetical protein DK427_08475 [Methylobacterium radiodurans]|uniref:SapC family protein n=1 Tax=Methylobacterium radiodurans TaxID=2202828 RepID=A0A2U8VQ62_9HYPH|nr:hypothetical protein DK427_08475 [Methylobacterium radiodurans]